MKKACEWLDIKSIWKTIFMIFFICVPLFLLPEGLFVAFVAFALVLFFVNKVNIKRFSLFIFILALALRVCVVFAVPTPPASDFQVHFEASQQMVAGDNNYLEMSYFKTWAYQIGIVFFQSLFLRIWNNVIILKLVNCIISAATCVLVYKIANEFTENKPSQGAALIYCFLPFTVFYPTILSNQYPSSFLIYLGIYIVISKKLKLNSYVRYSLFGGLLALADVFRPESIIPLFATVLFLLITINKENIKQNFINIGLLLIAYFGVFNIINSLFIVTQIAPLGLSNNDPLWKFVSGFNHSTKGQWSLDDTFLVQTVPEIDIIKSRVFVPIHQLIELFVSKIKIFWCGTGVEWAFSSFYESGITVFGKYLSVGKFVNFANATSMWMMVLSYLLVIWGVAKGLKKKTDNPHILLLVNQIFVTFGVYLIIEVQPRYIYHIQISVLIVVALGISAIYDAVKKWRRNHSCVIKDKADAKELEDL